MYYVTNQFFVIGGFTMYSGNALNIKWGNAGYQNRTYTFKQSSDAIADIENCVVCDYTNEAFISVHNFNSVNGTHVYTTGDGSPYNAGFLRVGSTVNDSYGNPDNIQGLIAPKWVDDYRESHWLKGAKNHIYIETSGSTVTKLMKITTCEDGCTATDIDYVYLPDMDSWARNTGTTEAGSERVGTNLDKGEPNVGFESSELKWWSSPDKSLGSYIAKENPAGQSGADGTTAYVGFWRLEAETDISFISLVERLSGQSHETVNDAFTWLNNNGYATTYRSIPNDPFFYLDPGSRFSVHGGKWKQDSWNKIANIHYTRAHFMHPDNGSIDRDAFTSWTTQSDNGIDWSKTGEVGITEYGHIDVDGPNGDTIYGPLLNLNPRPLNDYAPHFETSGLGDQHTLEVWFRSRSVGVALWRDVAKPTFDDFEYHFAGAQILQVGPFHQVIVNLWNGTACERVVAGAGTFNNNEWHHLVRTYDGTTLKCYLDGVAGGTLDMTFDSPMDDFGFSNTWSSWRQLFGPADTTTYNDSTANAYVGDYGIMKAYTRALTSEEILDSFNRDRTKYGI